MTFRRRPWRPLNVLCAFNLRPVSAMYVFTESQQRLLLLLIKKVIMGMTMNYICETVYRFSFLYISLPETNETTCVGTKTASTYILIPLNEGLWQCWALSTLTHTLIPTTSINTSFTTIHRPPRTTQKQSSRDVM